MLGRIWKNYISSGLVGEETSPRMLRIKFINVFALVGICAAFSFGTINYLDGNYFIAYIELGSGLLSVLTVIILRNTGKEEYASSVIMLLMFTILCSALITGGNKNTGIFWYFTYPILAFYLKEIRQALLWVLLLYFASLGLLWASTEGYLSIAYESVTVLRLLAALGAVSLLVYLYAEVRDQHELIIKSHTEQLEKANLQLLTEIVERTHAQETATRFQDILNETLDMIFLFDPDNMRFFYVNRGATEQTGYSRDELMEMTPDALSLPENVGVLQALMYPMLSGRRSSITYEATLQRKDGSNIRVSVRLQLVKTQDNRGAFVAIVRDLSEHKKIDRMQTDFISMVSHELRTPLSSILGALSLLQGENYDQSPENKRRKLVDIAYRNSERMQRLVNHILDSQRIESGKMGYDLEIQDLLPLIKQAIDINQIYAQENGMSIVLNSQVTAASVNTDGDRIIQIITNLLSNAVKFSFKGDTLEVNLTRNDPYLRIEVVDHGQGVPDELRERLFQKFVHTQFSDTDPRVGAGLSLSLCKALIEDLGGKIGFESQADVRTAFYIDLPEHNVGKKSQHTETTSSPRS